MEISHRSPEFIEIAKQAEQDFRDLLSISEDFAVLFTHGGATMQNAMVPLNLATQDGNADYVNSGSDMAFLTSRWRSATWIEGSSRWRLREPGSELR
jgi:phosphoserine aminotransferase